VELAAALELSDIRRNQQLSERLWTPLTREVVNDKQLEQRYRTAGIEHLFFVWAVTDPGERQRSRITRYGNLAYGKGSFPDAPERPLADEFDAWLAPRVRAALQGYRRLPPPGQA
jgi:hypothetical protein